MKLRCIGTQLSDGQEMQLGYASSSKIEYQIVPGNEYLVLGMSFLLANEPHGGGAQYQILDDFGGCRIIPACLFAVIDDRCSRYWHIRQDLDGAVLLWPEEFFADYFHDDLSEGFAGAIKLFKQVVDRLSHEFDL